MILSSYDVGSFRFTINDFYPLNHDSKIDKILDHFTHDTADLWFLTSETTKGYTQMQNATFKNGFNSPICPIELMVMASNYTNKTLSFINLGYWF